MEDEEPTLRNIAREFSTRGYWARARERKRATRTVWDLIFMPIGFGFMGLFWFAFYKFLLWLHVAIYPADAVRLHALLGGSLNIAQALMFLVPMFSVIPLGLMASNALFWLVPAARRASEAKARGVKWASYRQSQLGLFKLALVMVPIGIVSGVIGAILL